MELGGWAIRTQEGDADGSRVFHQIQTPSRAVKLDIGLLGSSTDQSRPIRATGVLHGVREPIFSYPKETLLPALASQDTVVTNSAPLYHAVPEQHRHSFFLSCVDDGHWFDFRLEMLFSVSSQKDDSSF